MLRQLLISVLILFVLSLSIFWILGRDSSIGFGGFSGYMAWLGDIFSGDLGISSIYQQSVGYLLLMRLKATILLLLFVLLLIVPFALLLGVLAGAKPNSWFGKMISFIVMLFSCMPEFTIAILVVLIFSYQFDMLPYSSGVTGGFQPLILPIIVLFLYGVSHVTMLVRGAMITVMQTPYIHTAVMKGVPFHQIVMLHALRNVMMIVVKKLIKLMPWLFSSVMVTEIFADYQGLGTLLIEALLYNDIDLLQAGVLLSIVIVVLMQLLTDLCYKNLNARTILRKID
ncbi:MAG: ABC transporter permease [Alphaproteobacteria bacterium]|nr:ABC transporter permease [Alphaproteobacteria bacterium]